MNHFRNTGLIVVACVLLTPPAYAQTTVSEARGYLALKKLASDSLLQKELSLSNDEVMVLGQEFRKYSERVDALLKDERFPTRRVLLNSLTPEIEAKLDEILTAQTFQGYSHHAILQKVGSLDGLVNLEGINDYLELKNERFEALRKFLKEENLALAAKRREWVIESFRAALRNAPRESYLKVRNLLGAEWLPEHTSEPDAFGKPPFPTQAAYVLLQYSTDTWETLGLPANDIETLLSIQNANRETKMRYITARGPVRADEMNQELRHMAQSSFAAELSSHSQKRLAQFYAQTVAASDGAYRFFQNPTYSSYTGSISDLGMNADEIKTNDADVKERIAQRRKEIDRIAIARFFDGKSRSRLLNLQSIP